MWKARKGFEARAGGRSFAGEGSSRLEGEYRRMRKTCIGAVFFVFLITVFVSGATGQATPKPLSKDRVVLLLKGDVSPVRVAELVRERGIDFATTPEVEKELRSAGATDALITTLRGLAPKRSVPESAKQQHGNTSIDFALERRLTGHTKGVLSVQFSPDGQYVASGAADATIKLWRVSTRQEYRTLIGHTGPVRSVAFSPDGRYLASSSEDQTIKIWDMNIFQVVHNLLGHTFHVSSITFSPDGRVLASGGLDSTIRLWDVSTSRESRTLKGDTGWIRCVAFSPDGRHIASGNDNNTVKVWDTTTGTEVLSLGGHRARVWSIASSPDGRHLASAGELNAIKIWDLSTAQEVQSIISQNNTLWSLAFNSDGRYLASAGGTMTVGTDGRVYTATETAIELWDTSNGQKVRSFMSRDGSVNSVAFSPDMRHLAWTEGTTIALWAPSTVVGQIRSADSNRTYEEPVDLVAGPNTKSVTRVPMTPTMTNIESIPGKTGEGSTTFKVEHIHPQRPFGPVYPGASGSVRLSKEGLQFEESGTPGDRHDRANHNHDFTVSCAEILGATVNQKGFDEIRLRNKSYIFGTNGNEVVRAIWRTCPGVPH
jgi:WD40 repeat protein